MFILFYFIVTAVFAEETVTDIIRKHGYPCEEHYTTTADGYVLALHRIPHGKIEDNSVHEEKSDTNRQPIIMQHGLFSSSGSWTLDLPHKAPAFLMADAGLDVWLTNCRGSTYSKNHTSISPESKEFWQFSWDEMAKYDLPSFIDYVLDVTEYEQLYYIGHSLGTTIFFGGMSINPSYNKKIKGMFALAPVGTVSSITSPIRFYAYYEWYLKSSMEKFEKYEFLPKDSMVMEYIQSICSSLYIDEFLCENLLFLTVGFDKNEFNTSWIPAIEDELLSGTSLNTILHISQWYRSGKFQFFDYGSVINKEKYDQITPPEYNLSDVTAPVYLMWAMNDYLADEKDIRFLIQNLPNIRYRFPIPYDKFNHLDFLWATHAKFFVYNPILRMLKLA